MGKITKKTKQFYLELLAEEKQKPLKPERLRLVDDELTLVAAAWPYVKRNFEQEGDSFDPWDYVEFSQEEWAMLAGVEHDSRFKKTTKRLITLDLVYSDGSVPKDMGFLLAADVKKRFSIPDAKPKKPPKKDSKSSKDFKKKSKKS